MSAMFVKPSSFAIRQTPAAIEDGLTNIADIFTKLLGPKRLHDLAKLCMWKEEPKNKLETIEEEEEEEEERK